MNIQFLCQLMRSHRSGPESSLHNGEVRKLQEELFLSGLLKVHGGFLVLTLSFHSDDPAPPKARMLYHSPLGELLKT